MSCSVKPTTTTRFGSAGTTVSPYLCVTVTGNVRVGGRGRRRRCGRSGTPGEQHSHRQHDGECSRLPAAHD